MMRFAFKGTDYEPLDPYLNGPSGCAIVGGDDPIAPARIMCDFAKKADKLEIKGGVVEGKLYDADGIKSLSTIPSREVLLSKLLGSLQAPVTNFARVIKQIAEKSGEAAPAAEAPAETVAAEAAPAAETAAPETPAAE